MPVAPITQGKVRTNLTRGVYLARGGDNNQADRSNRIAKHIYEAQVEYTPEAILKAGARDMTPAEAAFGAGPAVVRRLVTDRAKSWNELLVIRTDNLPRPLAIPVNKIMTFGSETIEAMEYFNRVIERGDMIDAALTLPPGECFPMEAFWIRIEYVGSQESAGHFSKKDDGLFALRAKAGEKAERVVARHLRDVAGHVFPDEMCRSPGYFEIRYQDKKQRKPDRKCLACGLVFEVKKRNKDEKLRVSHSDRRPFATENSRVGWHAFVFPDMKPRYIANVAIANAIAHHRFAPGSDRYDAWADIDPDAVQMSPPPACIGRPVDADR